MARWKFRTRSNASCPLALTGTASPAMLRSARDFLRYTSGFRCPRTVVDRNVPSEDVVGEICDVLANLIVAAGFDDETIVGAGAQVHFANGDAPLLPSPERGSRLPWASRAPGYPANGSRLADAVGSSSAGAKTKLAAGVRSLLPKRARCLRKVAATERVVRNPARRAST